MIDRMRIKKRPETLDKRRLLGSHLTPVSVFQNYILPDISPLIHDHNFIDMFCGEGNLILPILDLLPRSERTDYFRKHIQMYDADPEMVSKSIEKAAEYGVAHQVLEACIKVRDSILSYPEVKNPAKTVHITNPPYLYVGHIMKHADASSQASYFVGENEGYQDLYQLALINDLRHSIHKLIYIIPTNFLFADSASRKIRLDFLTRYYISKCKLFESRIFQNTGVNVGIFEFILDPKGKHSSIEFDAVQENQNQKVKRFTLDSSSGFRQKMNIDEMPSSGKVGRIKAKFYLTIDEVMSSGGDREVILVDSKNFSKGRYSRSTFFVDDSLHRKLLSNPLFVRTVDTGSPNGRAGLHDIGEELDADGIVVSGNTYRTNPIQLFIQPDLTREKSMRLMHLFNSKLEKMRSDSDSSFMTTYRYSSNPRYIRKYLGLKQVSAIISSFRLDDLS
ncbi:MAG: N-6 DNA methylase [Candidatus Thermoplasmatota archaeon]|nr:N-6 DNA methylase [Candidatus Thermoplasmatota archaeon]